MGSSLERGELFSGEYRKLVSFGGKIAEGRRRKAGRVPEKVIHSIWSGGYFNTKEAFTEDGQRVTVVAPGRWNSLDGPDFIGAQLTISGQQKRGDVEIHFAASEWLRHNHNEDPSYNEVILHVVVKNDLGDPFVQSANGKNVAQLVLERLLDVELGVLSEVVDSELQPKTNLPREPKCRLHIRRRWDAWERIGRILDKAGDERMLSKAGKAQRTVAAQGIDQAAYELVMECLGYERNKVQFLVLAKRASSRELKRVTRGLPPNESARSICALLLGVAGLLELGNDSYSDDLRERWRALEAEFANRIMSAYKWHFVGARPANFPPKRMAAASQFLARHQDKGLLSSLLKPVRTLGEPPYSRAALRATIGRIGKLFTSLEDDYWSYRTSMRGKRLAKPQRLIGGQRFKVIFINAVIPLFLLYSRNTGNVSLERTTHSLFCTAGRLAPNRITRQVSELIFGKEDEPEVVFNARRQQGLHQVYRDFCAFGDDGCRNCAVVDALSF